MSDLIERHAVIEAIERDAYRHTYLDQILDIIKSIPSTQPEPLTLRVNNELTKEEYGKLMRDIKDAPIVLLPYEQPDRKTGEWLHDLLQDAIDDGIITEAQTVRIMERANK